MSATAGQRAQEFLDTLPTLRELRAAAREDFGSPSDLTTIQRNYDGQGTDRYLWEDGAGNEATILLNLEGEESEGVIFVYEHESDFNTYNTDDPTSPFDALPDPYNLLKTDEGLFWRWDDTAKRVEATAAVWWDGDTWQLPEELAEAMDDAGEDGGLSYCLAWLVQN